jgi:hypothetical protein
MPVLILQKKTHPEILQQLKLIGGPRLEDDTIRTLRQRFRY